MAKQTRDNVEASTGNVFADLGFPHPERELLKARLTLQIYRLIRRRKLTQAAAGDILGIRQPTSRRSCASSRVRSRSSA